MNCACQLAGATLLIPGDPTPDGWLSVTGTIILKKLYDNAEKREKQLLEI